MAPEAVVISRSKAVANFIEILFQIIYSLPFHFLTRSGDNGSYRHTIVSMSKDELTTTLSLRTRAKSGSKHSILT
jgi:hypothetical protein